MSRLPLHIDLDYFDSDDGVLLINGRPVTELAARASGPFYAYDASVLTRRLEELRSVLPSAVKLHYAMKANPMPEVVAFVSRRVDGIDVASSGELEVALKTNVARAEISFAGPGKSMSELKHAIAAGIVVIIESETELDRVVELSDRTGTLPKVAFRVNPDFELKGSGMKMSGGPKPFGIDAEKLGAVLARVAQLPVDFRGLHIFAGSQNLRSDSICDAQNKSLDLSLRLCEEAGVSPSFLNLGGGFGIPMFPGDQRLVLDDIGANLARVVEKLQATFAKCSVVIELGRYIVGEAGVYVCEITDVKESRGHTFLITNGGLHHHLAASGNFGQIIRKNYPVAIANRLNDALSVNASVVGPLCTPLDLLADKLDLPNAEVGDLVAVFQSGAYGYSASPHRFLSHPPPQEFFCE
jgi:diaminopimelate decarboxylase